MSLNTDPNFNRVRAQYYDATRAFLDRARAERRRLGLIEGQPMPAAIDFQQPAPDPYIVGHGCACRHASPLNRLFPK